MGKRDRYGRIVGKVWIQPPDCLRYDQRSRLPPRRIRFTVKIMLVH